MKKLLLMIGITGVLGLVNVATRADAAIQTDRHETVTPAAPQDGCDAAECNALCKEGGCFAGICVPRKGCECIYENGSAC
jgi:hypothetical protein